MIGQNTGPEFDKYTNAKETAKKMLAEKKKEIAKYKKKVSNTSDCTDLLSKYNPTASSASATLPVGGGGPVLSTSADASRVTPVSPPPKPPRSVLSTSENSGGGGPVLSTSANSGGVTPVSSEDDTSVSSVLTTASIQTKVPNVQIWIRNAEENYKMFYLYERNMREGVSYSTTTARWY